MDDNSTNPFEVTADPGLEQTQICEGSDRCGPLRPRK